MDDTVRQYWDEQADTFDDAPGHGLRDPEVRRAWSELLLPLVPPAARVADLGCGTGTLSVLLAGAGHDVHGVDLAPRMVEAARAKAAAAGASARFSVGDAVHPPLDPASVDVVLARHVLWAFEDPVAVLETWVRLVRPGGRLVLVEGRWSTGAGLTAAELRRCVLRHRNEAHVRELHEAVYWGGPTTDERYVLVSPR